jgi:hypothetical protein
MIAAAAKISAHATTVNWRRKKQTPATTMATVTAIQA